MLIKKSIKTTGLWKSLITDSEFNFVLIFVLEHNFLLSLYVCISASMHKCVPDCPHKNTCSCVCGGAGVLILLSAMCRLFCSRELGFMCSVWPCVSALKCRIYCRLSIPQHLAHSAHTERFPTNQWHFCSPDLGHLWNEVYISSI